MMSFFGWISIKSKHLHSDHVDDYVPTYGAVFSIPLLSLVGMKCMSHFSYGEKRDSDNKRWWSETDGGEPKRERVMWNEQREREKLIERSISGQVKAVDSLFPAPSTLTLAVCDAENNNSISFSLSLCPAGCRTSSKKEK